MDVRIIPRRLRGTVTPPPSKSYAHRFVLAELLAGCDTFSVSPELSDDIRVLLSVRRRVSTKWPTSPRRWRSTR